jgi:DNA-binding CsgD family transcriptional regulator
MLRKTLYHDAYFPSQLTGIKVGPKNYARPIHQNYQIPHFEIMQDRMEDYSDSSSYFFLLDFVNRHFLYVSKSVKKITGYNADDFLNGGLDFSCSIGHPKEESVLKKLHRKLFAYYYDTDLSDRARLKFTYNMRLKRKDDAYMNVLQQTMFVDIAESGEPLSEFSTITDITPFKKDQHLTLVVQKLNSVGEYEQVHREEFYNYDFAFTPRQLEIMSLISRGLTTKEIAANLFLSMDTVKNHRKNILRMTGSKNVVEVFRSMVS